MQAPGSLDGVKEKLCGAKALSGSFSHQPNVLLMGLAAWLPVSVCDQMEKVLFSTPESWKWEFGGFSFPQQDPQVP